MSRKDNKGRVLHTNEYQRKADGLYVYRYKDAVNRQWRSVYSSDLRSLRKKEEEIQRDLYDGLLTDTISKNITLNELFELHMSTKTLAESTRINYLRIWQNRIRETLGVHKVVNLRSCHVKSFYTVLSKAGYARSTIRLIHNMIYGALEQAVEDDLIRKNPASHAMNRQKYGREVIEKSALSIQEQENLLNFVRNHSIYQIHYPMFVILLETGIRCGEFVGLTWKDIDMVNKMVHIDHQLIYRKYEESYAFHISRPKTKAGSRIIPMTDKVYDAFLQQKKNNFLLGRISALDVDGYSGFIFVTKHKRPLMPSAVNDIIYNVVNAYNQEELKKAKRERRKANLMPKISAHSLRHTACSTMAMRQMNPKILQNIMGHASSHITMDVYTHITDTEDIRKEVLRCSR